MFTEDYHKTTTVLSVGAIRGNEENDLLSCLTKDHTPAESFVAQVAQEISAWQAEPRMDVRYLGADGKWVYNSVMNYWNQVKGRFPLLTPIAQQVC